MFRPYFLDLFDDLVEKSNTNAKIGISHEVFEEYSCLPILLAERMFKCNVTKTKDASNMLLDDFMRMMSKVYFSKL